MTLTPTIRPGAALPRFAAVLVLGLGLGVGGLAPGPASAQPVPSFADLAEKLSPAVVNISTAQTVDLPEREGLPFPEGSPFEDLFRDFFEQGRPRGPRQVQSLGSGFVISAEGYVVTNNHVIEEADEITVNLSDGRSLEATVVGTDPKTDLALLKVEPTSPLPFVGFGDSDAVRVGDWVLAIGNPFGLGGSVSAGIVSARNRDIQAGPYDDFLQTDAAINRGNSGGPLFGLDGQVIGINTAIISPSGGSIGIGFAVPANLAKPVIDQLQKFGTTRRGWLGVRIQSVNEEMAEALGMEKATGALVADVNPGSPAEEAGIEPGDVILKFDGKDVTEMRELPRLVADTEVEKTVRVVVFRKGKTQTLKVKIALLEEAEDLAVVTPQGGLEESLALPDVGLTLVELTEEGRKRFDVAAEVNGVLVTEVTGGGPAAEKGVRPGDVIVEVGQEPVGAPAEVEAKVAEAVAAGRKSVLFLIQSGADLRFVPLAIGG
ncbi:MAG TPA: DegQ family serine endoprotease [Thermohalobaculum sp.]|nr:DegQ family serine endoprotease [Thermohalobaculum sp.]